VPRCRRVLLINVEILPDREHDRLSGMVRALNMTHEDLDRLLISNIKGLDLPDAVGAICATIRHEKPEVCIIDPLYLIHGEDENDQKAMTEVFRRISSVQKETACTIVVVHHDAKGKAGDRDKRDRGSGSGIMGRFSDSRILLTPHKDNPEELVCIETLCRYVPPQPGIVCRFVDGILQVEENHECTPETSKVEKAAKMPSDKKIEDAAHGVAIEIVRGDRTFDVTEAKEIAHKNQWLTNKTALSSMAKLLREYASSGCGFEFVATSTDGARGHFGTREALVKAGLIKE
jgi:RecA-family ATPase